jgi:hypothetical protein
MPRAGKDRFDQRSALRREIHYADPPFVAVLNPAYQPPGMKAVHGYADGSRRQTHLRADHVHRQRAFMQQHFQRAEVGIAQSRLLQIRLGQLADRLERLNKDEPYVDPRRGFYLHAEPDSCIQSKYRVKYIDINIFDINLLKLRKPGGIRPQAGRQTKPSETKPLFGGAGGLACALELFLGFGPLLAKHLSVQEPEQRRQGIPQQQRVLS